MDDLQRRLDRVYAAIGETATREPAKLKPTVKQQAGTIAISFDGGLSEAQIENAAMHAVFAVGHLPDHMRKWARKNGKDPKSMNRAIGRSQALRVVIDLANVDKHGDHDRGGGLSGLRPRVTDLTRALRLGGGPEPPSMTLIGPNGPEVQGDVSAVICGTVRDSSGKYIGQLDQILSDALKVLESLLEGWQFAAGGNSNDATNQR